MRKPISILMILITAVVFGGCSSEPTLTYPLSIQKELIPMRDFFKNPETIRFAISPDGNHIAMMKPWKSRMNIFIRKIDAKKALRITAATKRDISDYFWANNNTIAFIQDKGGDENFHLFTTDITTKKVKELTPFPKVRVTIIDSLEDQPNLMLIGMNKRDKRAFDVYRLELDSGKLKMIAKNPGTVQGWLTDNAGKLRVAIKTDGVNSSLLYRATEKEKFKTIITTNFKNSLSPLFFNFDNKQLFVASNLNRDKEAIYRFNPITKKTTQLIFEHPSVDVNSLYRSKARKIITGVSFKTEKRHYKFFDPLSRTIYHNLKKKLAGYEAVITSRSKDERKMIIRTYSDRSLGSYYFYQIDKRGNTKKFFKIVSVSPWLDENKMATQKPIKYKTRDGLTIHGYLTLPQNLDHTNLPVIINPHGGPWTRNSWGFNSEIQFLANRGYAVLQMNFRGSTGYGKKFWTAGFKQWGRKMQDDITDGVKWLIKKGIADPKRIGIYGGSYGGYAVLAGLAFTPNLYACGVDYVGVSNIFTLLKTIPPYWKPILDMLYEMVGNPKKDKKLLTAVSPVFHADKIKAPLFVAQGANDPRVKKAEADQIVNALKKRGIAVKYMVKENEGHGFHNEENRFDFYKAMEKFLWEHLYKNDSSK